MAKLFSTLCGKKLYSNEWAETLDWLFDENKFPEKKGWNNNKAGNYTKKIKRMEYISPNVNYYCDTKEKIICYLPKNMKTNKKGIYIVFSSDSSESKSLIRHIRNGIAHGQTKVYTYSTKKYSNASNQFIEIQDFGIKDKKTGETQTAYINIPLEYIVKLHNLYIETEKESSNSSKAKSSKKRTTAKKQTKQPIKV